jgi:hypothetical protein
VGIWRHVYLPLSRPALATLGAFTLIFSWNDFLWPLLVLNSYEKFTLALHVALSATRALLFPIAIPSAMALVVVSALPVLALYLFADRQLMEGMTLVGLEEHVEREERRQRWAETQPPRARLSAALTAWTVAGLVGLALTCEWFISLVRQAFGNLAEFDRDIWVALLPLALLWPLTGLGFALGYRRLPGRGPGIKALVAAIPLALLIALVWPPIAIIARLFGIEIPRGTLLMFFAPWFVASVAALALVTAWLFARLSEHPRLHKSLLPVTSLVVVAGVMLTGAQLLNRFFQPSAPPLYLEGSRTVLQTLEWGDVRQSRASPADTEFVTAGRKLYVLGDVDGGFRPRSNPYDLYAFGGPAPNDPLANKLQGVWTQPVKVLNGYGFVVNTGRDEWPLLDARRFTQTFANAQFDYERGPLTAARRDFVPQDLPALFTTLTLRNTGNAPMDVRLTFFVHFDVEDAWFTDQVNVGEIVRAEQGRLIARGLTWPPERAAVVGGDAAPDRLRLTRGPDGHRVGLLEYSAQLEAGEAHTWAFGVVVESEGGPEQAQAHLAEWLSQRESLLAEKQANYQWLLTNGPRFHSPDPAFDAAFDLARANLQLLEAEAPKLGRYFYAGLPTFPFWFSNDGAYSTPGLLATGLITTTEDHLRLGAEFGRGGRIPHQISPSGRIVGEGNAEETPLWVMALWDSYRWTGDRDFLAEVYPRAVEGMFDRTLGTIDFDKDGYPAGPGMVEREDMGAEKLDSAAYTWAALRALAQMAEVMDDPETAARARAQADSIAARFDADWWNAAGGTYAMSLEEIDNAQRPVPHWAVVTPLEVGLASPDHAATTLITIRAQYLSEWGLKHTVGDDERVWTLPTAALSRAAYRYSEPELGFEMLTHIAQTLAHGSIGMFHELIPEGLSFVQLWSSATFVRGAIEDLLGVGVRADTHSVTVAPRLPPAWDFAEVDRLAFGGHLVTIRVTRDGATITHVGGPAALSVRYRAPDGAETTTTLEPGETIEITHVASR